MSHNTFIDQMGHAVTFRFPPQRIVSLVPSQTELLYTLGLDSEVVGITKFCVHPPVWRKSKILVGGTKNFRIDVIRNLRPDVILGNKEENYKAGIEALQKEFPVWLSDVKNLTEALQIIYEIGRITGRTNEAEMLMQKIKASFDNLQKLPPLRVVYLIWKNPWMGAGRNTFIHEMLSLAGLENVLHNRERYPELTHEELRQLSPEAVLLSSEPYPFSEKHVAEIRWLLLEAKVLLVDGEMFSWYGSRMLYFADYVRRLKDRLS